MAHTRPVSSRQKLSNLTSRCVMPWSAVARGRGFGWAGWGQGWRRGRQRCQPRLGFLVGSRRAGTHARAHAHAHTQLRRAQQEAPSPRPAQPPPWWGCCVATLPIPPGSAPAGACPPGTPARPETRGARPTAAGPCRARATTRRGARRGGGGSSARWPPATGTKSPGSPPRAGTPCSASRLEGQAGVGVSRRERAAKTGRSSQPCRRAAAPPTTSLRSRHAPRPAPTLPRIAACSPPSAPRTLQLRHQHGRQPQAPAASHPKQAVHLQLVLHLQAGRAPGRAGTAGGVGAPAAATAAAAPRAGRRARAQAAPSGESPCPHPRRTCALRPPASLSSTLFSTTLVATPAAWDRAGTSATFWWASSCRTWPAS